MGLKYEDGKAADQKFADFINSKDSSKLERQLLFEMDAPHPDDPSRTKLGDLASKVEKLRERVAASGEQAVPTHEIRKMVQGVMDEYDDPLENDPNGALLEEYVKKLETEFEGVQEDI
jgi:hypothetical protein